MHRVKTTNANEARVEIPMYKRQVIEVEQVVYKESNKAHHELDGA